MGRQETMPLGAARRRRAKRWRAARRRGRARPSRRGPTWAVTQGQRRLGAGYAQGLRRRL